MSTRMKILIILSLYINLLTTIYIFGPKSIREYSEYKSNSQVDIERLAKDLTPKKEEQQKLIEAFYNLERVFKTDLQNLFFENQYVTVIYNSEWDRIAIKFSSLEPKEKIEEDTRWLYWPKYYLSYTIDNGFYSFFYGGSEYSIDYNIGSGWPIDWDGGWIKIIKPLDVDKNYWKKTQN